MDSSQRSNDVSPEAMQARIQQARREAETLKDRIKRKKDELADTTRESFSDTLVVFSPSCDAY
jgi:guanine nucleotide-binding protein G(I)/G(S)/G(T) subunit beta-1